MLVAFLWAFNISVVKVVFREMEPLAFNIVRFLGASVVLLALVRREGPMLVDRGDIGRLVLLGVIGHTLYQTLFILGLSWTTASSAALIFGTTPIVVAVLSRIAGHERVGARGMISIALGFAGVYLIVSRKEAGDGTAIGDLFVLGAAVCWSIYTVLAKPLLSRSSPLRITAITLAIGTVLMIPASVPSVLRQDWASVSWLSWSGLVYSFVFALVICYVLWYRSVHSVGSTRTALYSNLVPVLGSAFGVWILGDELTTGILLGAGCVLAGIVLMKLEIPAGLRTAAGMREPSP